MGSLVSTVTERPSVRCTVTLSDLLGRSSRATPAIRSDSDSTAASPRPSTCAIPTLPCTKAVATRKGLCELRFHDLSWTALRRPAGEFVAMSGGVRLDRHRCDVIGPLDLDLRSCCKRGIDR